MKSLKLYITLFLVSVLLILQVNSLYAQAKWTDEVYLKNESIISGLIIKNNEKDDLLLRISNGDTLSIKHSDVFQIKGSFLKDFNAIKYNAFGIGLGNSYGGLGIRFQHRFEGKTAFAYHIGAGLTKDIYVQNPQLYLNLGLKYFYYKFLYVDLSAGSLQSFRDHDGFKTIYGLSILTGVDYLFNEYMGLNIAVGASSGFQSGFPQIDYLTFDLGFIVKIESRSGWYKLNYENQ